MNTRGAEGVLLTGVYGSGKSAVAMEIAYLLEQRAEPYALLDLDYLSWGGTAMSPAAAATICVKRRRQSRRQRVPVSRMWSSATTVPSGSWLRTC